MKSSNTALIALLGTGVFVEADLYTITTTGGEVLRYTNAPISIAAPTDVFGVPDVFALTDVFQTLTWSASGPFFDDPNGRALAKWRIGLDIDTWSVRVTPRPYDPITGETNPDTIGNVSWLAAAAGGALDGATVLVQRAFLSGWPQPWQTPVAVDISMSIIVFLGRVAAIDVGRSYLVLNVNDFRELFTTLMPRNLYQSGCHHTLFDSGCTLSASAFAVNGVVTAVNGNRITAALPQAAGYYNLGRIFMTSGDNNGFFRKIMSWDGATLVLIAPFYFTINVGDTFTVYPGCDKSMSTCSGKFNNLVSFGGQPFIPSVDTSV